MPTKAVAPSPPLAAAVAKLRRALVIRAKSLLITIYGDAIAPRTQSVWLGSLIALMAPFGVSPRLVRTSAFRLAADDWFDASRVGRRSFYALSQTGMLRTQHADRRIYEFNLPAWDGHWTVVLLDPGLRASERQHLARELLWESFGQLAPNVFAHPHVDHLSLREILQSTGLAGNAAVLRCEGIETYSSAPLQSIMHTTFALHRVEHAWKQFIARFAALGDNLQRLTPAEAFYARTLLIHEYRRVLLRDPNLPEAFLPAHWPGVRARQLCEALYRGLLGPSENHLMQQVTTLDGRLAATPSTILQRLARG